MLDAVSRDLSLMEMVDLNPVMEEEYTGRESWLSPWTSHPDYIFFRNCIRGASEYADGDEDTPPLSVVWISINLTTRTYEIFDVFDDIPDYKFVTAVSSDASEAAINHMTDLTLEAYAEAGRIKSI